MPLLEMKIKIQSKTWPCQTRFGDTRNCFLLRKRTEKPVTVLQGSHCYCSCSTNHQEQSKYNLYYIPPKSLCLIFVLVFTFFALMFCHQFCLLQHCMSTASACRMRHISISELALSKTIYFPAHRTCSLFMY